MVQIDIIADVKPILGEGPLWDVDTERIYWIDALGGVVYRATADGREIRAWDVPGKIGAMALRRSGGAVVALQNGFHFLDFETGDVVSIVDPEPHLPNTRLNDGKVDRAGRFVCGSMDMAESAAIGGLYSLGTDLKVTQLDRNIMVSNGPCWSLDNKTLYFADSFTQEIWAYDYDLATGEATNRRTFVKTDTSRGGYPDGSTVDAEGFLWNASVYDGRIFRYAPDGRVDRVIVMPVKKTTSVMFGGPNLDILFVTSMAKPPLPQFPGDPVLRGSLFGLSGLGVRGVPEPKFGA
jgi:L-arabinonolactonase